MKELTKNFFKNIRTYIINIYKKLRISEYAIQSRTAYLKKIHIHIKYKILTPILIFNYFSSISLQNLFKIN
jgi:hypothetical protein